MKKQLATNKGFIYNENTGKLESYEFIRAEFKMSSDAILYVCKVGGEETEIDNPHLKVYASTEDYEYDVECDTCLVPEGDFGRLNINTDTHTAWVFIDGNAEEISIDEVVFVVDSNYKLSVKDGTQFYTTREEVFKYNDYIMVDEQGVEYVVESVASKMRMTAMQMNAVQNLQEAIKILSEHNIRLYFNTETGELFAYNFNNVQKACVDYEDDIKNEHKIVYDLHTKVGYIMSIGYDETLGVQFKDVKI